MTGFKHQERVSRQQAAERLADIAYALTAGGTLELRVAGEQLSVRVVDEVLLKWRGQATGDHVMVEVELSWLACDHQDGVTTGHPAGGQARPAMRKDRKR